MWPGSAAGQREGCGLAGSALGTAGCPPQATQVSEKKPAYFSAVMLRDNAAGVTVTSDET